MNSEYLLVNKKILPAYYELVIKVRKLINEEKMNVSDACKKMGISRSTFYKYKDYIFLPTKEAGKKAILAFHTLDEKGILMCLLGVIASYQGNVISINQDTPIGDNAYITISISINDLSISLNELILQLKAVKGIKTAELLALE